MCCSLPPAHVYLAPCCLQVARKYDGHDAQLCLTMVTLLLMLQPHFKNRLEALKDVSAWSRSTITWLSDSVNASISYWTAYECLPQLYFRMIW